MKKSIVILTVGLAAAGLLGALNPTTVRADYYRWLKTKSYSPSVAYHAKMAGSIYLWNAHHTRVLHNLKNYSRTTWYKSAAIKMNSGYKSRIYYHVTSGNGEVTGYIWRGYLSTGVNPNESSTVRKNGSSGTTTPATGSSLTSTDSQTNQDKAKGILYANVPYSVKTDGLPVMNPNPATATPSKSFVEVKAAVLQKYAQIPGTDDINQIVNYVKTKFGNWDYFRIVMEKYQTQDNQIVKLPTLQYGDDDADRPTAQSDASFVWKDAGVTKNILEIIKHPGSTSESSDLNTVTYLVGKEYIFPDLQAAVSLECLPIIPTVSINPVPRVGVVNSGYGDNGDFSLVNFGNNSPHYVLTSDMLELPKDQPVQKNGLWIGTSNPWSNAIFAGILAVKGVTHYRQVGNSEISDYKLINGTWQHQYSIQWGTAEDPTLVKFTLQVPNKSTITFATANINSPVSVMDYLYKSDDFYQQVMTRAGN
ncbi:hypothetical protein OQI89_03140 [Lentilactobacillus diolivorans]|uniref:hypothetical protein n=1 Tax=Lentilactobacillus diolivorans TaxID=179838 RepID=UPI0024694CE5|nr:hypothetical protein [Lentilactobacillus diolivorans]MDH5104844.1 hypothetical protein [Lentilactobacillus diolivorans]